MDKRLDGIVDAALSVPGDVSIDDLKYVASVLRDRAVSRRAEGLGVDLTEIAAIMLLESQARVKGETVELLMMLGDTVRAVDRIAELQERFAGALVVIATKLSDGAPAAKDAT